MTRPADSPPREIDLHEFVLRPYQKQDVAALAAAVSESLEHLRPWMPWTALEPATVEDREKLLAQWDRDWAEGVQYSYGMFREGRVVGGAGLMRRIAPGGLEIGYWVHKEFTGRGFATRAAEALTTLGLGVADVTHIEIHHDRANLASRRVPDKLGFVMVGVHPVKLEAPGQTGVDLIWRMDDSRWAARRV
jgi:RimJ/RimL family protein N-acetyltransferase